MYFAMICWTIPLAKSTFGAATIPLLSATPRLDLYPKAGSGSFSWSLGAMFGHGRSSPLLTNRFSTDVFHKLVG
jgi:hypothetical protein